MLLFPKLTFIAELALDDFSRLDGNGRVIRSKDGSLESMGRFDEADRTRVRRQTDNGSGTHVKAPFLLQLAPEDHNKNRLLSRRAPSGQSYPKSFDCGDDDNARDISHNNIIDNYKASGHPLDKRNDDEESDQASEPASDVEDGKGREYQNTLCHEG